MTRAGNDLKLIHIGKLIEKELRHQKRSVMWLSRQIPCDRRNIYDIFLRQSIDTDLLYKISTILNRDFFSYYSSQLHSFDETDISPPAKPSEERL